MIQGWDETNESTTAPEPGAESESDQELARREAEWRKRSAALLKRGTELLASDDWHEVSAGAKLMDVALKYENAAATNREKRAVREHERMLIRHEREMSGLRRRGSH